MDRKSTGEPVPKPEAATEQRASKVLRFPVRSRPPTAGCHDSWYHQAAIDEAARTRK